MANMEQSQLKPGRVFNLHNVAGGTILDNDTGWGGKKVQQWQNLDRKNQMWEIEAASLDGCIALRNVEGGRYLAPSGKANGSKITVSDTPYAWKLVSGSKTGSHKLEHQADQGMMLCNSYGRTNNGNVVWSWQWAESFDDMMSWYVRPAKGYGPYPLEEDQAVVEDKAGIEDSTEAPRNDARSPKTSASEKTNDPPDAEQDSNANHAALRHKHAECQQEINTFKARVAQCEQAAADWERRAAEADDRAAKAELRARDHEQRCVPQQEEMAAELERLKRSLQAAQARPSASESSLPPKADGGALDTARLSSIDPQMRELTSYEYKHNWKAHERHQFTFLPRLR